MFFLALEKLRDLVPELNKACYFIICVLLGPYPFERWHNGGTFPNVGEPNNGGGVRELEEDCGAMQLDIIEPSRFDFTSSINEFWNDVDCNLELPFACEIGGNHIFTLRRALKNL